MAKEIKVKIKLQITGGSATPAPPVGSSLGQQGVNIMEFCKQFNAQTADRKGEIVPVLISVYTDKSFSFVLKTPPVTELIKKRLKIQKGSSRPHEQIVGTLSSADVEEIARIKLPDLNAHGLEEAKKIVIGSARSMGVTVLA